MGHLGPMDKWADYLIVEVVFNAEHTRIVEAICRRDTGDTAELCPPMSRDAVIDLLDAGYTFATAAEDPYTGALERGRPVYLMRLGGEPYIKSRRDLWSWDTFDSGSLAVATVSSGSASGDPQAHSG